MTTAKLTPEQEAEIAKGIDNLKDNPRVSFNGDGSVTMLLNRPIKLVEGELVELKFRDEVTAGDVEESEKSEGQAGQACRLIAALTGVSYGNVRKLRLDDLNLAALIVGMISGKGQETGGTS